MNNNGQTSTGNPLLDYFLNNQGKAFTNTLNSVSNAPGPNGQSFSDMMGNRQKFITQVNNQIADQVSGNIKNGSNGVAVNPVPLMTGMNQNQAGDSALTSQLWSNLLNTASGLQSNANNNAASVYGTGVQGNLGQQNINLQKAEQGFSDVNGNNYNSAANGAEQVSPNGTVVNASVNGDTGNPLVDGAVKNILNGSKDIGTVSSMPPALQNMVYGQLQKKGYDPSKQATDALNQVEKAYFGYLLNDKNKKTGGELSAVNNPEMSGMNAVTNWLSNITGGAVQLGNTPKIQNYKNLNKTLQANVESAIAAQGGKPTARLSVLLQGGAPSENTSLQDAQNYFKAVREAMNNSFFPNGINPHENQIRVKIGNMVGTINEAQYDPKTMQKL